MAVIPFACGACHQILKDGADMCPDHPEAPLSTDYSGLVEILQPDRSEIAKKLGITRPGKYALKVTVR